MQDRGSALPEESHSRFSVATRINTELYTFSVALGREERE